MGLDINFSKEQVKLSTFVFEHGGEVVFKSDRGLTRIVDISIKEEHFTLSDRNRNGEINAVAPIYRISGSTDQERSLNGIIRSPIILAHNGGEPIILPPEFHYAVRLGSRCYLGQSIKLQREGLQVSVTYARNFDIENVGQGFSVKLPTIVMPGLFTSVENGREKPYKHSI